MILCFPSTERINGTDLFPSMHKTGRSLWDSNKCSSVSRLVPKGNILGKKPTVGFEPTTTGLQNQSSTVELRWQHFYFVKFRNTLQQKQVNCKENKGRFSKRNGLNAQFTSEPNFLSKFLFAYHYPLCYFPGYGSARGCTRTMAPQDEVSLVTLSIRWLVPFFSVTVTLSGSSGIPRLILFSWTSFPLSQALTPSSV